MTSLLDQRDPAVALRYTAVAILLHWLIALAVLANLYLGWRMDRLTGMDKFTLFQLHKSIGITILALSLLRLIWRLFHRPPAYPATIRSWERTAAHVTHWSFYALIIGLPISGWILVSASPFNLPTLLFKTVPLPHIGFVHDLPLDARKTIESNVGTGHIWAAYLMAGLIVLHVAAALKHQFVQRDGILGRMVPGVR